jgi:hypothetical protein
VCDTSVRSFCAAGVTPRPVGAIYPCGVRCRHLSCVSCR